MNIINLGKTLTVSPVKPCEPLLCPPEERTYYQDVHGFDPESGWQPQCCQYRYEERFSLAADPQLSAVGITIGARVEQVPGAPPTNRIIFRNQAGREKGVYCTHTVLYAGPVEDALRFADDSILQNNSVQAERDFLARTGGPVQLPPWGHFAALKSYVAGIAEVGIITMLGIAAGAERAGSIPITFGFNAAMQRQVLSSLRSIAPEATDAIVRDYFLRLLDDAPLDWVISRLEELDRNFSLAHVIFSQPEFLQEVLSRLPAITISELLLPRLLLPSPSFSLVPWDSSGYALGIQVLLSALPPTDRERAADFIKKLSTRNVLVSQDVGALIHMNKTISAQFNETKKKYAAAVAAIASNPKFGHLITKQEEHAVTLTLHEKGTPGKETLISGISPQEDAAPNVKYIDTSEYVDTDAIHDKSIANSQDQPNPEVKSVKTTAFIDTGADIPVISPAAPVKLRKKKKTCKRSRLGSKGTL